MLAVCAVGTCLKPVGGGRGGVIGAGIGGRCTFGAQRSDQQLVLEEALRLSGLGGSTLQVVVLA